MPESVPEANMSISVYDTCSLMNGDINWEEPVHATKKCQKELKEQIRYADRKNKVRYQNTLRQLEDLPEIKIDGGKLFGLILEAIDVSYGLERVQKGHGEPLSKADADYVARVLLYENAGYDVTPISADKAVQQTYETMKREIMKRSEQDEGVEVA